MADDTPKRADNKPTKISGEIKEASMERAPDRPKDVKKNK